MILSNSTLVPRECGMPRCLGGVCETPTSIRRPRFILQANERWFSFNSSYSDLQGWMAFICRLVNSTRHGRRSRAGAPAAERSISRVPMAAGILRLSFHLVIRTLCRVVDIHPAQILGERLVLSISPRDLRIQPVKEKLTAIMWLVSPRFRFLASSLKSVLAYTIVAHLVFLSQEANSVRK
jgi:hypothetical protein